MNYLCVENLLDGNSKIEEAGKFVKFRDWKQDGTTWAHYNLETNEWLYVSPSPIEYIGASSKKRYRIVNCNECKHRLLCLLSPGAKRSFEQR